MLLIEAQQMQRTYAYAVKGPLVSLVVKSKPNYTAFIYMHGPRSQIFVIFIPT